MSEDGREHGHVLQLASQIRRMDVSMMARMKELDGEKRRLKKMYMDENLKAEIVAKAYAKKW
jgi:putative transposase